MTWEEKVEARARKEGMRDGRKEGMKDLLLHLLEVRFHSLPRRARARIRSMSSMDELRDLGERLTSAQSLALQLLQLTGGENDSQSRELGRFVKSVAQNEETDMTVWLINRRDRYLRASDHVSYQTVGYPAARFTEPNETFAHEHQNVRVENGTQFGDLIDFVDFAFIARVAKVNLATLWSLSQGPGTPKNAQIVAIVLTNSTTMTWNANTDPDLAGYEIVWRETTSPEWTNAISVGNVTTFTLPLAPKDNFQFGVRAVDKDGHHSPVAFPVTKFN